MLLLIASQCLCILAPTPRSWKIIPVWSHSSCFWLVFVSSTIQPGGGGLRCHWFQLRLCLPFQQALICLFPARFPPHRWLPCSINNASSFTWSGPQLPHSLSPQAGDMTAEQVNWCCLTTGETSPSGFAALATANSKWIWLPTRLHEYSTLRWSVVKVGCLLICSVDFCLHQTGTWGLKIAVMGWMRKVRSVLKYLMCPLFAFFFTISLFLSPSVSFLLSLFCSHTHTHVYIFVRTFFFPSVQPDTTPNLCLRPNPNHTLQIHFYHIQRFHEKVKLKLKIEIGLG